MAREDVGALEQAIETAARMQVEVSLVRNAQKRLEEINGEAERQARRETFGLGSLPLPNEFVCPITCEKMRGAHALLPVRMIAPHVARVACSF